MSEPISINLSHYVSVFRVFDIKLSKEFYQNELGFKVIFEWGDPVDYAMVQRDEIKIHLAQSDVVPSTDKNFRTIYIFTYDVDLLFEELQSKNVDMINGIANRDYGMRDFDIRDPDGNIITFGCEIDSANT